MLRLFVVCMLTLPTFHVIAQQSDLLEKYNSIKARLHNNPYQLPLVIESVQNGHHQRGEVYALLYKPFSQVKNALTQAANWCDITSLHLNIKACTYLKQENHCHVSIYSGRKFYEAVQDTYQLNYTFTTKNQRSDYFITHLSAPNGPLGTHSYDIDLEAMPISDEISFVHFSYEYAYGFWANLATSTYLATLGSDKIGFSITGLDEKNQPVYINGVRGIIERNAVRYFFAIKAYLETSQLQPRLSLWFDLTEQFPDQLHEMSKQEYLDYKHREHLQQQQLQGKINQQTGKINTTPCPGTTLLE